MSLREIETLFPLLGAEEMERGEEEEGREGEAEAETFHAITLFSTLTSPEAFCCNFFFCFCESFTRGTEEERLGPAAWLEEPGLDRDGEPERVGKASSTLSVYPRVKREVKSQDLQVKHLSINPHISSCSSLALSTYNCLRQT